MLDTRLRTLIVLAHTCNYTRAAALLNLTQPAVSQHIKSLETQYQTSLVHRKGRQIRLTKAGDILLNYAKKMETMSRTVQKEILNESGERKKYDIGATLTIGNYVLPQLLGEYKKQYGHIDLMLQVDNTELIVQKLLREEIDLGVIEGPFDKTKVCHQFYRKDELVLVASPDSVLAQKGKATIDEVLREKLILREPGSGTRRVFEDELVQLGYDLTEINIYMQIGSLAAIKSMVESGLGYTVISREAIKKEIELGILQIVPIQDFEIKRAFNFIYLEDGPLEWIKHFMSYCTINQSSITKSIS